MSSDTEKQVMEIYRESAPDERGLVGRRTINHVAWSLLLVSLTFSAWLMLALANAENQRNALANRKCMDRVFNTEIDHACLKTVKTRDHWWEHVGYALTHLKP